MATVADRIIALGSRALTRAETILESGTDSDAAKIIGMALARIAPVSGPNVIMINGVNQPVGAKSPAELIRARLDALRERQIEPSTAVPTLDDLADVIDAEIVDERPETP